MIKPTTQHKMYMSFITKSTSFFTLLITLFSSTWARAITFSIRNNCPITLWAAALPGGGRRLDLGQTWSLSITAGTNGRIWARTGCSFDGAGRGRCQTGDCNGLLQCQVDGAAPNTLVEFQLSQSAGSGQDFFDISVVSGFNVPIELSPEYSSSRCTRAIRCVADINGQCPNALRTAGGCHNACTLYGTNQYCCTDGPKSCGPTDYSRFFKERCRDAYSYPFDDQTSIFTCPEGADNYRVVFCP